MTAFAGRLKEVCSSQVVGKYYLKHYKQQVVNQANKVRKGERFENVEEVKRKLFSMADHVRKGNLVVPFNCLYVAFEVPKHHANMEVWENEAFEEFV